MESIKKAYPLKNLKKSVQKVVKNPFMKLSRKQKFVGVIFFLLIIFTTKFLFSELTLSEKVEFYPTNSQPSQSMQRIYQLFENKQYLTLTSYIDQQIMNGVTMLDRPDFLFYQAESYFQLKQYEVAKKKFETLHREFPHFWQTSLRLAGLSVIMGDLRPFVKLTTDLPASDEGYYWWGRYYQALGASTDAIENYYKSDMNDPRVNFQLGSIFYHQKKYETAISFLKKAENLLDSRDLDLTRLLFYSYTVLNDRQNVIKYSNALKPYINNNLPLVQEVATSLYNLGELEQARSIYAVLDTSKKLTPQVASILTELSYELKDYPSVIRYAQYTKMEEPIALHFIEASYYLKHYNQVIHHVQGYLEDQKFHLSDSDKVKLLEIQANSYEFNSNLRNAVVTRETIENMDASTNNELKLIELYRRMGSRSKIFSLLDYMYTKKPENLPTIVEILMSLSEFKKAQNYLTNALSRDSSNVQLLFSQSKLYLQQKNWQLLRTTLHSLVQQPIQDPTIEYQANYALGSLYIQSQNYLDAQIFMEKAKSLDNTRQVNIKLLLIYYLEKDYDLAFKELKQIKEDVLFMKELTDEEQRIMNQIEQYLKSAGY